MMLFIFISLHIRSKYKKVLQNRSDCAIVILRWSAVNDIGNYLKEARCKCHFSLKQVHSLCGVTDSKLSRMERGESKTYNATELKILAQLYGISVVPLYIMAGFLDANDLSDYQLAFKNADLLNEEEKESIQTQIDLLTKGRRGKNDF